MSAAAPPAVAGLAPEELARYARHLVMPEVGVAGQERLKAARVLIVGAGGLGSPAALYLAAAGVGTLGIVEFDRVDASNLQRQVLYGEADIGRPKLETALARLADVNPHVRLVAHPQRLAAANARELVSAYDIVVDGSDNFPTRYLVNDACVAAGKPDVWGAILRFEGQAAVFWGSRGPCYRCLFPEPPPPGLVPGCAEGGVFGVLPGVVGAIQAVEVIKLALGVGEPLIGRLLLFDALALRFREVRLPKDPACPVCAGDPRSIRLADLDFACPAGGGGEPGATPGPLSPDAVTPRELAGWIASPRPPALVDVREPWEWQIARLPGARLVPLGELARRAGELDPAAPLVLYCHHGVRSWDALRLLRRRGFASARHLAGGIEAYRLEVDPTLRGY